MFLFVGDDPDHDLDSRVSGLQSMTYQNDPDT